MERLVHFSAPDVRDQSTIKTMKVLDAPAWKVLRDGVNYQGLCPNFACCPSRLAGRYTVCQMGLGKFRPNEQLCYKEIACRACGSLFVPHCYIFKACSAKINFCIAGESADKISLSENRENKARQLGKRGKTVVYEMLVIEVERPGTFPDLDSLDILDTRDDFPTQRPTPCTGLIVDITNKITNKILQSAEMSPAQIHFIQDSIANRFQCGRSVRDTMEKLKSGILRASAIPTIRIFQWNGKWHTEDNRRLWCFKKAGLSSVPVKRIDVSQVDTRKFSTRNNGESVVMR